MKLRHLLTLLAVLLLAVACSSAAKEQERTLSAAQEITANHTRSIKGNLDAPVMVIEYGDYACSSCISYHSENVYGWLKEIFGDEMAFQYRHYAVIDPNYSPSAALANECAGEQGRFWEYHDIAYEREAIGALDPASLELYARKSGVDPVAFNKCMEEQKYASLVAADTAEIRTLLAMANQNGQTPSFIVNGKVAPNDVTKLRDFIQAELDASRR